MGPERGAELGWRGDEPQLEHSCREKVGMDRETWVWEGS